MTKIELLKTQGKLPHFIKQRTLDLREREREHAPIYFTGLHGVVSRLVIVEVTVDQAIHRASDTWIFRYFCVTFLKCEERIKGDP